MTNRLFLLFVLTALQWLPLHAENGDWRIYCAYHDASQTAFLHDKVYVVSDGDLYSYDPQDTSVETYDKVSALSDFGIQTILPCEKTQELVIVYTNGNIDIMDAKGNVFNMPDLKMKPLSDKTINEVSCIGAVLYVCVGFNIVCVNIEKHLFEDSYTFPDTTRSIFVFGDSYYVLTKTTLYKGSIGENLLNPGSWVKVRDLNWIQKFFIHEGRIYGINGATTFYVYDTNHFYLRTIMTNATYNRWSEINGRMFLFLKTGGVHELTGEEEIKPLPDTGEIFHFSFGGGQYWAACGTGGLKAFSLGEDNTFTETLSSVIPNSPQRNYSYHLRMEPNQRLLVAGGAFNYPGVRYMGTLMKYENNTWTTFDEEGPLALVGSNTYMNLTDLVQDPLDSEHHWASAARSGLYEFRDYKLVNHYTYDNSPLETILPDDAYPENYVRVTALEFDSQNNLWMCNNDLKTIVRILRKDGTWTSYHVPEIETFTTFDRLIFDRRGWAWVNSRRMAQHSEAGFLVINTNGNPGNPSGFSHRFISTFSNQDGNSYTPTFFYCITEDLNGTMWFGCEAGLFISENPADVFSSNYTLTQIKVPRNDGSNLADYLLSGVAVKCIAVDGGNRKWVGTNGNGVYLISADGLEQLAHFTTDNSPLISDGICDITIDGKTGEVFIATDAGLVSYFGNATDPADSLDENNVRVYPNPVRPEYSGDIIITGLAYNTNVKIVNAAGRLLYEGTSVGGEFTWNGRLASGDRCASGIYYVLSTDESGNNGVVSKFLMVRE